MDPNPENRRKTRFEHESTITVENSDMGFLRGARMFNFSDFGLCIGADFLLQPETEIRIGINNSPFASEPDTYQRYNGVIKWREELINSSYYYGYGVELIKAVSDNSDHRREHAPRKHPRKVCAVPLQYTSQKQVYRGIIENVSRGGLFIKYEDPVIVGQEIKVQIPIRKKGKTAKVTGKVAWANQQGFGIRFLRSD